jgi:hypothetical protein
VGSRTFANIVIEVVPANLADLDCILDAAV